MLSRQNYMYSTMQFALTKKEMVNNEPNTTGEENFVTFST